MNNQLNSHRQAIAFIALIALALNSFVIQPAEAASFLTTGSMTTERENHTATLLPNGKVLVAGGDAIDGRRAELYDPATGVWTANGAMITGRSFHTATLLPNGKVLVAGGFPYGGGPWLKSAELYDPASGTWTPTGSMTTERDLHTATLLPNGRVLVAGGYAGTVIGGVSYFLASAEVYDPATGTWTPTGSMNEARESHTATLLANGKVLVAGGSASGIGPYLSSAELYDPVSGVWTHTAGRMNNARTHHTATLLPNGNVLAAGGESYWNDGYESDGATNSADLYNPSSGLWTMTGAMNNIHVSHSATLLPNGKVLIAGGEWQIDHFLVSTNLSELYDPSSGTWTTTGSLNTARGWHSGTLLPNGRVLVAGGLFASPSSPTTHLSSAELYDWANGTWTGTGGMTTARDAHAATLLPNGKVLVAGGEDSTFAGTASAELYDWTSGAWTATGSMNATRISPRVNLLANGKVLVAGGLDYYAYPTSSAELYDSTAGAWTTTGSMTNTRAGHTATLLPNGKVLVAGGQNDHFAYLSTSELYDPASGTWAATGSMTAPREHHTATLLPSGKVLVAAGYNSFVGNYLFSAELYDPLSGTWTATGSMSPGAGRTGHTATLLPNGKILVAGGNSSGLLSTAELYDPVSGTWTATGSLNAARTGHWAVLLPNGKVLVAGGSDSGHTYSSSAELYDPASGTWAVTTPLISAPQRSTATLLPNGKVLVGGGRNSGGFTIPSAELYDVGLGFSASWQPQITTFTSPLSLGGSLVLTGSRFRGVSEGSGGHGSQDSPGDYPLVQVRSLANEQTMFLLCTNWSINSFNSQPLGRFPPGYVLITVFVNGIPSTSSLGVFAVSVPVLSIALSGGNAVLSWSANYPGYALETTPSLNPAVWTRVPGTPAIIGSQYVLPAGPATGSRFFHLAPIAGTALSFDGTSAYVSVPHNTAFNITSAITIEGWIKATNGIDRYIVTKGDDSFYLAIGGGGGAPNKLSFYLNGVSAGWLNGTTDLNANQWHHVAATYDGASLKLYVDGQLENSANRSGSILTGTNPVLIGARPFGSNFGGLLDEFRIWNMARTQAQIQANMNHLLSAPQANLVGYWRFDEGSGTSAFDSSGQGNTGTLQNAPAWVVSGAPLVP